VSIGTFGFSSCLHPENRKMIEEQTPDSPK
jgi:hypothetical protein